MSGRRSRAKRLEFFFGDYLDSEAAVLEVGPGDGWLGDYLISAGFSRYFRWHREPPADLVGALEEPQRLGLEPASIDLLIAFDPSLADRDLEGLGNLVKPGGMLFAIRRAAARGVVAAVRQRLASHRAAAADSQQATTAVPGFRTLAARRAGGGELWLRLQRLA